MRSSGPLGTAAIAALVFASTAASADVAKAPTPGPTISGAAMCRAPDGGIMAMDDWHKQNARPAATGTPASTDHSVKSPRDSQSGLATGRTVPDCPKPKP